MRLAVRHRSSCLTAATCAALFIALGGAASAAASGGPPEKPARPAGARPSSVAPVAAAPACPDAVIPGAATLPGAVGCWNAIAVQAVRAGAPYATQGLIYMAYTQAAVYDAITKIEGRYTPYDDFKAPAGANLRGASPDAAAATAAYTTLTSAFLALPAPAQAGLSAKYSDYIDALGGAGIPAVADGMAIGRAAASDVIADRTGDRDESITFTPGPLTPGGWTFAPLPSLQSAQTPWVAVMRPFMLTSPSQFRSDPPPALASHRWATEFNETKAYGAANSAVRSPQQTAIAQFWNASAVNQSNQAFQDVAIAHHMNPLKAARAIAMGDLVDSDAAIAWWDSKYHYQAGGLRS